jgi:hypothetical protein
MEGKEGGEGERDRFSLPWEEKVKVGAYVRRNISNLTTLK